MAFSLPGSRWILRGFSSLRRRMGSRLNQRTSAPTSCVQLPPPTRQTRAENGRQVETGTMGVMPSPTAIHRLAGG